MPTASAARRGTLGTLTLRSGTFALVAVLWLAGGRWWATPALAQSAEQPPQADERDIAPTGRGPAAAKDPKLESRLKELARTARERGAADAAAEAERRGLRVDAGTLTVVAESGPGGNGPARAAARGAGGRVEAEYADLIQVRLPMSALEALARHPDVRYLRPPFEPVPVAVSGEGVGATNAAAWHGAGATGVGVKVGVVDLGFSGYAARQASGDLPAALIAHDLCGGGLATNGSDHGTAVAEIVHEMAPGAQLYLICINNDVALGQALDYALAQGIRIVNHSVAWFGTSRGDGSGGPGTPDAVVAAARAGGILWVNAAGNSQLQHWTGTFSDTDGDDLHNYTATDQGNTFSLPGNATVCVSLKWDAWPTTAEDFDLLLVRSSDSIIVAASESEQTGTQPPRELLCYQNPAATSQNFAIFIRNFDAIGTPRFDLFIYRLSANRALQYSHAAGSVVEPATSPHAMAVGAICWQTDGLEFFSSQGPTIGGQTKPDIAGPDSVTSATAGPYSSCPSGFAGTSAAAPHAAGAAALLLQTSPSLTAAALQSQLEERAIDLGSAGKDNAFGAGKLTLGPSPPDLSLTKTHTGNFKVGTNGVYTLTVSNALGAGPTTGTITLTDTLPTGLSFVSAIGTDWSCGANGQLVTCTRTVPLAGGANSAITLTVGVGSAAAPGVTNTAAVSTPGEADTTDNSASDPTTVSIPPDLTLAKTHTGTFTVGANGVYTLTVTNAAVAGPTTGATTVTDTLPAGLTFVSGAGVGWSCAANAQVVTCTHAGSLAPSANAAFTLAVAIGSAAVPSVTNVASVATPGEDNTANNGASDPTTVEQRPPDLALATSHSGQFIGATNGNYTLTVSNASSAGPTVGPITVTDTLPTGLSFVSGSGAGWSCQHAGQTVTCTHAGALAPGASSAISLTVFVSPSAVPGVTNTASVATPTETNTANNSASDPTVVNAPPPPKLSPDSRSAPPPGSPAPTGAPEVRPAESSLPPAAPTTPPRR